MIKLPNENFEEKKIEANIRGGKLYITYTRLAVKSPFLENLEHYAI